MKNKVRGRLSEFRVNDIVAYPEKITFEKSVLATFTNTRRCPYTLAIKGNLQLKGRFDILNTI